MPKILATTFSVMEADVVRAVHQIARHDGQHCVELNSVRQVDQHGPDLYVVKCPLCTNNPDPKEE